MKGIIYEYYNTASNMYYIGQTRRSLKKRDWEHRKRKCRNSYFERVYHKHPEQFTLKILKEINIEDKLEFINTLNKLEIEFISNYKAKNLSLYNILDGGNSGFKNISPTINMLKALEKGRNELNSKRKQNKFSEEEIKDRHNKQVKEYALNNPKKYKEIYTNANNRRKEEKRQWYLKNKERILKNQKEKRALN